MARPRKSTREAVKQWVLRDETAERYPHLRVALEVLIQQHEGMERLILRTIREMRNRDQVGGELYNDLVAFYRAMTGKEP